MTLARTSVLLLVAVAAQSCCGGVAGPGPGDAAPPRPTVAIAGPDQTVDQGAVVALNGGASTPQPGAELVAYAWKQTSGPPAALEGASAVTARLTAPPVELQTVLELSLTVTDSAGGSASDAVRVTVLPAPCVPRSCAAAGKSCGSLADGCGGTLECGTCTAPATCGGGGVANVCGAPATQGFAFPFGPYSLDPGPSGVPPFTMWTEGTTATELPTLLSTARSGKMRILLALTGGAHENYMTNGVFDLSKWKAKMDTYSTPALKQALAAAVADGTVVGNSVMDEPHVSGQGDGNTWGPPGTMTKAEVDDLCAYVKAMFPFLPTGVVHRHDLFEPEKDYAVCEFLVSQYSTRIGPVAAYRDSGLAFGKRSRVAIMFSMNVLNGGTQDRDGTYDCTGTGGKGTYAPNCRMTATQLRDYGLTLGPAGWGLAMWRYDATFFGRADNQQAFRDIADRLKTVPSRPLLRQ